MLLAQEEGAGVSFIPCSSAQLPSHAVLCGAYTCGDSSFWHLYQLGIVSGTGKMHCKPTEMRSNSIPSTQVQNLLYSIAFQAGTVVQC